MRIKNLLCASFCLFVSTYSSAQTIDFSHYSGLHAAGILPKDFTTLSSEKYQGERGNINTKSKRKERKTEDDFYLQSSFSIDKILHSGRVVFGDPVTNYLNLLKNEILKSDPELRDKIRIYTYRNNEANAFTTNSGIVLVTTGLVAQCENEAQLAFILCHEFNHYIKKHAIQGYVESKRISRGKGVYKNLDPHAVQTEQLRYSKDLEMDADKLGVELFLKSNYSIEAINSAFDVLLYSYLPFDEVEFDTTYFNSGNYIIPGKYFLDSLKEISAIEDYDDSESSHPNIKRRKESALEKIGIAGNNSRKDFLISENTFNNVQKICRFEAVKLYLNDVRYEEALYAALLLEQEFPNNPIVEKSIARALFGISRYKTERSYGLSMHTSYKKIEGSSQQIYYFAEKMPAKEFSILALKYIWDKYKKDSTDETFKKLSDALIYDIVVNHKILFKDFLLPINDTDSLAISNNKDQQPNESIELNSEDTIALQTDSTQDISLNKYKKIKKQKEQKLVDTKTQEKESNYWKYAFEHELEDPEFKKKFESFKSNADFSGLDEIIVEKRHNSFSLGIDSIVVVDPYYTKVDEKNKVPVNYIASENAQLALHDKIDMSAKKLELDVNYVESNKLDKDEVDEFNQLNILNDWLSEMLIHSDHDVEVLNSMNDEIADLAKEFKTENFVWIGILSIKQKEQDWAKLLYGWIFGVFLPFIVADLATPDYETYFFCIAIDAFENEFLMSYSNGVNVNDHESIQNSNIYYMLQQIKSKPKK